MAIRLHAAPMAKTGRGANAAAFRLQTAKHHLSLRIFRATYMRNTETFCTERRYSRDHHKNSRMKWNGQYEPTGEEDLMMNIRYTDYYEAKMAKVVRVYLFNSEHLTSDQIDLKNPHPWLIVRLEDIKDTTGEVRLDMSKYDVKPAIRISLALNLRLLVRKLAAQGRVTRINAVVVM